MNVEMECPYCHKHFPMVFRGGKLTCPACGEVLMWVGEPNASLREHAERTEERVLSERALRVLGREEG